MKSPRITWISSDDPPSAFPAIESAFDSPDGLLAAGGDLCSERLLYAYRHGIFPWFDDGQPILWWSPDPRCVLYPNEFHVPRRLRRFFSNSEFEIRFNTDFDGVIAACADNRAGQDGTWITAEMITAYKGLQIDGWAHSIEVWQAGQLVGGLYGLSIGKVFFGESMFSRKTNASKAAMLALMRILGQNDFALLDCQVETPHLLSLGARLEPRRVFAAILAKSCSEATQFTAWPAKPCNIKEFLSDSLQ
jgi:leucyl/phenylalanyl-tRNA--protein transferase